MENPEGVIMIDQQEKECVEIPLVDVPVVAQEVTISAQGEPTRGKLSVARGKIDAAGKKVGSVRGFINSPWLLIVLPLLVGGIWLVNNTWVITDNLNKPYALLAGPATIACIVGVWFVFNFFKTIAKVCNAAWSSFLGWRSKDGSTFWLVIAIFLTVSVFESGTYFNGLLGSNDLYGSLGYASAFVIDLVSVECMRARLSASRMRDEAGKRLYLFGVFACASLSAWANTYTALKHFSEPANSLLPHFMVVAAPWTGMAFPLLIIFLSFTADYTADQTSTKLDPDAYKISEEKRMTLLEIQRDMLRRRVGIEQEIDMMSGKKKGKKVKVEKPKRVFFLVDLLFPVQQNMTPELIQKFVEELSNVFPEDLQKLGKKKGGTIQQVSVKEVETSEQTSPNLLPEHVEPFEKDTDPTIPTFVKSRNNSEISGDQSFVEDTSNNVQPSEPITGKLTRKGANVLSSNSIQPLGKDTRKLSIQLLQSFEDEAAKDTEKGEAGKRNAITKGEAALILKCSVKEIEVAIANDQIKMYGNSKDKVLVSSLKNFVPARKRKFRVLA